MKSDLIKSLDTVTLYRDVIDTWCWEGIDEVRVGRWNESEDFNGD